MARPIRLCEFSNGRKFCREAALYKFKGKMYCGEHKVKEKRDACSSTL